MRPMVLRAAKLWVAFFRNCLSRDMEFKFNFIGNLFIDSIFYSSYFFLFTVIFSYVDHLGQFTKEAVIIFLVITYLTDTVFIFFFGLNTFQINRMVVKGDLDLLLLKPVNSLFYISFRYVACYGIISMILLGGLLIRLTYIYDVSNPLISIGIINYITFIISFLLGIIILYCLEFIVACLVFWYKNFSVGGWLCAELTKYSRRPDTIYGNIMSRILFSFFPMALVSSLPARMLLFGPDYFLLLSQITITLIGISITFHIWNKGLTKYDSASS